MPRRSKIASTRSSGSSRTANACMRRHRVQRMRVSRPPSTDPRVAMISIDPLTSLAMSVHANPGVYALLLGSGVSRSAQIPTGWGVTLDLINKLAAAQGEKTDDEPAAWFHGNFGVDADYSDLLEQLYDAPSRQAK